MITMKIILFILAILLVIVVRMILLKLYNDDNTSDNSFYNYENHFDSTEPTGFYEEQCAMP